MTRKIKPRKLMEKIMRRKEKKKRNSFQKKKPDIGDILYEKTKKLAKSMGVKFLKPGDY